MTNNLERRLYEHKNKVIKGFAARYNMEKLVYYEVFSTAQQAIDRETQLKGWLRERKLALIAAMNAEWKDLSKEWSQTWRDSSLRQYCIRNIDYVQNEILDDFGRKNWLLLLR